MVKVIEGDLVLKENTTFNEDLIVKGNIRCEGGLWNINAQNINALDINARNINARNINAQNINALDINARNINARNINARNINALDIDARDIDARDINAGDINAEDINVWNINALDIIFYAFAIAYKSFKCKSWKSRRDNYIIKCLDSEIEIKDEKKFCDKCGQELKDGNN
jgi:hypothetical protein